MNSLMFSGKEASNDSRVNVSNIHVDDTTNTEANSSDDANDNDDANEQQSNSTLRSIELSEGMEQKFKEGHATNGEEGPLHDAMPSLEESSME